jgi:hypothetical protein
MGGHRSSFCFIGLSLLIGVILMIDCACRRDEGRGVPALTGCHGRFWDSAPTW